MKLCELPVNTRFKFKDPMPVPVDAYLIGNGTLTLKNIDGMFSYCVDDGGNVYHPHANSEVEVVE